MYLRRSSTSLSDSGFAIMTRYKNNNKRRAKAPAKAIQKNKEKVRPPFRIIPLGGMKEIGKNCTLIECNDEILIIDCGFAFPEYEMFGIDIVIPDFTYLKENMEKVKGLIITHGHEDHIGGIPYLLQELSVPVYASPLAMGMIDHKLEEYYLSYSIKFPGGHVVHTGDFKIDYSPLDGKVIDLNRFSQLGDQGVDVLLCDSTNVMRKGYTPSEAVVRRSIDEIFDNSEKRIIIATFASNVHRIKYFIEASMKHNRRIAVSGRSMENVLALSKSLGYLDDIPDSVFVNVNEAKNLADNKITIITTGSQGEPMSALTRMAYDNHKSVKLKKNDVVVFSSSPIPGNEKVISQVVNRLYEKEVDVVLASAMDVHVSGHASSEELKLIHTRRRPKYWIPAHDEYRHLVEHSKLSQALGHSKDNIFILGNGDALEINGRDPHLIRGFTSGEDVMVDGYGIGDVGSVVLKERRRLSQGGLITISVALDSATGSLMAKPSLNTRGFIFVEEHMDLIREAINVVYNTIGKSTSKGALDEASLSRAIKSDMKTFIYNTTKKSPMIIPVILYV